jgi:hypothetical protein
VLDCAKSISVRAGCHRYAKLSFAPANWERLIELRKKLDPNGLFFDFSDGLN